jgi:hypothetical protein
MFASWRGRRELLGRGAVEAGRRGSAAASTGCRYGRGEGECGARRRTAADGKGVVVSRGRQGQASPVQPAAVVGGRRRTAVV